MAPRALLSDEEGAPAGQAQGKGWTMSLRVESRNEPAQVPFLTRRRVLLVEEDPRDLRNYAGILQEQGCDVRACASYSEGLRTVEMERFDFIIVNQGSLAFEARSIVDRVLTIDRRTPVLIITRCADMGCYLDAMQMGAVDYLEKPLTPSHLTRVIETHIRPRTVTA
jgi:DNA-binding NtrC family response regulator